MRALLSYPLQAAILAAIVFFSLLGVVADAFLSAQFLLYLIAGLLIWLFLLIAWTQYSFLVLRASAMGERRAPVVGPEDFAPWHSITPFYAVLMTLIAAGLFAVALTRFGFGAAAAVMALLAFVLPASLALLTLNGSFWQAISPFHIVATIATLGLPYLLMPLILGGAFVAAGLIELLPLPRLLRAVLAGYAWFLAVHALGRVLYHWRDRIGLTAVNAESLRADDDRRQAGRRASDVMEQAYQTATTDGRGAAAILLRHLDAGNDSLAERHEVFERMSQWPEPRASLLFAQDLIAREIAAGNAAEGLALTTRGLAAETGFRPGSANDTLRVAKLALDNGQFRVVTALLSDFAERYPDNASALPSMLMCAKVALEHTNEMALAGSLIDAVEKDGRLADDGRVKFLRRLLASA